MGEPGRTWSDERLEQVVGSILRYGVTLAAAVVLFGGCVYLVRHGAETPRYGAFLGEPADLRTFAGIVQDTLAFRGRGIIQLGLLLLIATPMARVAFSLLAFALQRDRVYAIVTLVVLGALLYGFVGGGF